jgi:hypothetical protein
MHAAIILKRLRTDAMAARRALVGAGEIDNHINGRRPGMRSTRASTNVLLAAGLVSAGA